MSGSWQYVEWSQCIATNCGYVGKFLRVLEISFKYCIIRSQSIFLIRKKFTLRLIGLRQILGENLNQSWTQPLGTWDFQELTFGTLLAWWLLTTFKTKLRLGAMIQSKWKVWRVVIGTRENVTRLTREYRYNRYWLQIYMSTSFLGLPKGQCKSFVQNRPCWLHAKIIGP